MEFEPFALLGRVAGAHGVRYDLGNSGMPDVRLAEVGALGDANLGEVHPGGSEGLRAALAHLHGGGPEEYMVTCGASEANFAVLAALVRPGDAVLVERPVYAPLAAIPRALGARVLPLVRREAEGFRVDVDGVRRALPPHPRLFVLTNLHNPTGAALGAADGRALADLAAAEGFYLLVDEIFRELALPGDVPTLGGLNEWVVVTSGLSKFYGAGGLRIGWVRGAPALLRAVRGVLDYMSVAPPGPSEAIALQLLAHRGRIADRNRRLIAGGRAAARAWAEARGLPWEEPPGHLIFPRIGGDTVALAEHLLAKHATFVAPGEDFGLGGHVRINVGRGPEVVAEGLARLTRALGERGG